MGQEDVFDGGAERTVIRPSPGGRRGPVPDAGPGSVPDPGAAAPEPFFEALRRPGSEQPVPTDGLNALISAASPLLALAARLRITASCGSIDTLHERIVNEIRAFERRVANASLPREALRGGHYALCATIDDVITNTPWGSAGQWARHSMTGTFHNDAVGGDRFFDFLTYFQKEPGRYGDVLELMYLCLSLGFQGRLRVVERGASEWARIREGLFNLLRQRHGDVERELSPHWRGLAAPHRPLAGFLPVWVIGVGTLALLTIAYIAYVYAVNSASDGLYGRFAALPPTGNATLQIASPALPPVDEGALARLRGFLAPEIRAGLVSVAQAGQTITVRLTGSDMFASGAAGLGDRFVGIVGRVALALDAEPGAVRIAGYTDDQQIRSLRFPSNYQLSVARAEAVRDMIKTRLSKPRDLTVEGRGEANPVAPNTTPEGRAANRRIEIDLTRQEGGA